MVPRVRLDRMRGRIDETSRWRDSSAKGKWRSVGRFDLEKARPPKLRPSRKIPQRGAARCGAVRRSAASVK
jgi:hypothetical protein